MVNYTIILTVCLILKHELNCLKIKSLNLKKYAIVKETNNLHTIIYNVYLTACKKWLKAFPYEMYQQNNLNFMMLKTHFIINNYTILQKLQN